MTERVRQLRERADRLVARHGAVVANIGPAFPLEDVVYLLDLLEAGPEAPIPKNATNQNCTPTNPCWDCWECGCAPEPEGDR